MKLEHTAETLNAFVEGLGAIVFALVMELPSERRAGFAATIAGLARAAEASGSRLTEAVLIEMHTAASAAASAARR
ncbi:MAG: hypothetical protein EOO27_12490 [Comamonadaceae bacterium]|nr:MAG: hypothetical protein EOO27_12490 [Comamonadaceae bacterium]